MCQGWVGHGPLAHCLAPRAIPRVDHNLSIIMLLNNVQNAFVFKSKQPWGKLVLLVEVNLSPDVIQKLRNSGKRFNFMI